MAYDGSLKFDTSIDEKGFNTGVKSLGSIAKSGLSVLAGAVAGVSAAMGAAVVAGVKYNASIESYQTSFEVMTGSAEKAASVIEQLKDIGASTPFELPQLADTTQLLMNYGFTADDAMAKMMMLGDISQGSADKMSRIAMAYGQMSSAGKVSLEDVKQMIEAGFNPLQEISDSTGESMESLYDRISDGTIAVDEITASMTRATSEGGKYFQSMEKQSQTMAGMISTLKDNAQQLLGDVVMPITESIASELLPGAIDAIEQLAEAFKTGGTEGLIEAGGQILSDVVVGIAERAPAVIETAINIINSFLMSMNEQLPVLMEAGAQILSSLISGIELLLPTLGSIALNLITIFLQGIIDNGPAILERGAKMITDLIGGIASALPQLIPMALQAILTFAQNIVNNLPTIIDAGIDLLMSIVEGIVNSLPMLIEQVPALINSFCDTLYSLLPQILKAGWDIIVMLGKGIINSIPTIIANAGEIFKAILNVFTLANLFSAGKGLISGLGNGIKSMLGSVKSWIDDVIAKIKNPFNINWSSIGRDIINGIASGISRGVGTIISAAKSAAKSALNAAKSFLGIKSPSRKFRDEVGAQMSAGIGIGFEDNIPTEDMQKALDGSMKKMQSSVNGVLSVDSKNVGSNPVYDSPNPNNGDIYLEETNIIELDGEVIAEKTSTKVIKKIDAKEKARDKSKGK